MKIEGKQKNWDAIIKNCNMLVYSLNYNREYSLEYISENAEQLLGYSRKDFCSAHNLLSQLIHPEDKERVFQHTAKMINDSTVHTSWYEPYRMITKEGNILWVVKCTTFKRDYGGKAVEEEGLLIDVTDRIKADEKDGAVRNITVRAVPFVNDRTGFKGTLGLIEDVTEEKKMALQLKKSREEFRQLVEHSRDLIIRFKGRLNPVYISPAVKEMLGYSPEEVTGISLKAVLFPEDVDDVYDVFDKIIENKETSTSRQIRAKHKNGYAVWLDMRGTYLYSEDGSFDSLLTSFRDITERKKDEERINKLLKENELLIREIHHRVKNDLSFVHSLLYIQAERSKTHEVRDTLLAASNRVAVVQRVYESLYRKRNPQEIELRLLVEKLIEELKRGTIPSKCEITYHVDQTVLYPRIAIAIGIILNELITNSIKYAFNNAKNGRISFEAARIPGDRIRIIYKDNGEGFPQRVITDEDEGFGLMMIRAIIDQYNGTMELKNYSGAWVQMEVDME